MGRIKTFINNGDLFPGDLNSIQDDYEGAFSRYHSIGQVVSLNGIMVSGDYNVLGVAGGGGQISSSVRPETTGIYLDPADFTGPRTTKIRVRAAVVTNAVAPGITFLFGLYPMSTFGGAAGSLPICTALGTQVPGSGTTSIATPAATTRSVAVSSDFTCPAAGWYAIVCVISGGAMAASSQVAVQGRLQFRQV